MPKNEHLSGFILGLVIASGLVFCMFGLDILDVSNIDWIINGDSGYHYLGWAFFKNEAWAYPLGTISNMMYPLGTNLMQLDSIPIVAILAKNLDFLIPERFQYFGLWTWLCFFLQSYFGYSVCFILSQDKRASICGALLLVLTPFFLFRFELMHRSLGAQWLTLWLFTLVFDKGFQQSMAPLSRSQLVQLIFINIISAGIHAYLFVAHLALSSLLVLDRMLAASSIQQRVQTLLNGLLVLVCAVGAGHAVGYFQVKSKMSNGFGYHSMDLLAPVNSFGKSLFLPALEAGDLQYEGFSYLGLGCIFLILHSLALCLKSTNAFRPKFSAFVVGLVGLYIFAMATPITFLGEPVISLDSFYLLFQPIPSAFRASGRFAWPALYFCVLTAFYMVAQHRLKNWVLPVLVVIQLVDLSPWLAERNNWAPKYHWQVLSEDWNKLFSAIEEIDLIPIRYMEVGCFDGKLEVGGFSQKEYTAFALSAAFGKLKFNSASISRPPVEDIKNYCREFFESLRAGVKAPNTLFVVHKDYHQRFLDLLPTDPKCENMNGIQACRFHNP